MRKDEFPIVDKLVKDSINEVLDKIRAEIDFHSTTFIHGERYIEKDFALDIIDKYRKEQEC